MTVESGYCVAMWVPRVRVFWMAGIITLHLGIAIFLGLGLFGLIMILLSISAFGYEVWGDIRHALAKLISLVEKRQGWRRRAAFLRWLHHAPRAK